MTRTVDRSILEMALVGYEAEKARVAAALAAIRSKLGQRGPGRPKAKAAGTEPAGPKKRGRMSAAGRARIAAAQRARWAAQKRQQAQPAPAKHKKRKMSAAGLRAIREATKRRWAAYRKAHKSAA